VLAIDVTPVDVLPCSVLGLLASLHKRGITIELLHPSKIVREELETTRLNQLFVVRD
jgi:anti-anti-sigma regulatory factor